MRGGLPPRAPRELGREPGSVVDSLIFILAVGIGATLALDLYGLALNKAFGIPRANWGLVGRWLIGLTRGRPVLADKSPPHGHETLLGWLFHYAVGLAFAAAIPLFWGAQAVHTPTPLPFIAIGFIASTLAGLTVLIPGMGGGFLASKLPNPTAAIGRLLLAHVVFTAAQYGVAAAL